MHVGNGQKLSVTWCQLPQEEPVERFWNCERTWVKTTGSSRATLRVSEQEPYLCELRTVPEIPQLQTMVGSRDHFKHWPRDPAPRIFCLTSEWQRFGSKMWFAAKLSQPALLVQDLILDLILELSKSLQMFFIWEEDRVGWGQRVGRGFLQGKGLVFPNLVVWLGPVAWF